MPTLTFTGFAGVRLEADALGDEDAPPVLLIHGAGQTRADWAEIAGALELAGRRVINVDQRGHGSSEWPADGRYDLDAMVGDIKAVLAQMTVRPVVVAATLGGWLATLALGEGGAHLAAGLVLVDAEPDDARTSATSPSARDPRFAGAFDATSLAERMTTAAAGLALPVLIVDGAVFPPGGPALDGIVAAMPDAERVALEAGQGDRLDAFNGVLLDFLERRVPLAAPEYREGSDARTFRDALGCFATGVTIVTAMTEEGTPIGLTANSFTSVSLDPPLLLVCIATSAGSAAVLDRATRFAVNVLQIGQQPTSNRFAGRGEDRFALTPWEVGEFGTPVLPGSLASFECERHALHDGGDHFILVGRVLKARFEPRRDPLLYFRGKYRRLHFA